MKIAAQNVNPLNINCKRQKAQSHIGFGKKFISKAVVRNVEGGSTKVNFVEYEQNVTKDREQIQRINVLWQPDGGYLADISNNFLRHTSAYTSHYYGLEDKNGDILVIAQTSDTKKYVGRDFLSKNCLNIRYIQTHPDEIFSSKNRLYKGLGEVLVSNIVKKAKKGRKFCVELKSANEGFWANGKYCNHTGFECGMPVRTLLKDDYDAYIRHVEGKNGTV